MTSIIPQNIYFQRLKQLDEKLIRYPLSEDFSSAMEDAYKLGKINELQKKMLLNDTVTAILYIIIPRENFKQELIERLKISPAYAEIIDQVIQKRIFEPLKDELEQYKYLITKPTSFEIKKPIEPRGVNIPEQKTQTENIPKAPATIVKEVFREGVKQEEINKPQPLPDINLPEIQEIKIERPMNKTSELKRVTVPEVTPEEQEKIHSKLMDAIKKKDAQPSIIEAIKKAIDKGIKPALDKKTQPKNLPEEDKVTMSQVVAGKNDHFASPETTKKTSEPKPYILDVKIKEEKEKKENFSKEEIKYQKPEEKPFGEA